MLGPGALFGEMPMFDDGTRSATARALTTVHVCVGFDDVREVLVDRPDCCGPSSILAGRLRATDEALADAMFLDVTGRTAKRLLELADGEDEFRMPLTQEELAGMVGASRERVNKAIATFVEARLARGLGPRPVPHPRPRGARSRAPRARTIQAKRARPDRGSVVGAVHGTLGVVHEAVVGAFDDDDLAVVAILHAARSASMSAGGVNRRRYRRSRASGTSRRRGRADAAVSGSLPASGVRNMP